MNIWHCSVEDYNKTNMAQTLFDALNGVDSQTGGVSMHLVLGTQSGDPAQLTSSGSITVDEDDLFQCGKCKTQFTSFAEFFLHKKTHNTVRLETVDKGDETNGLMYSEIVNTCSGQEFVQPITLSDSEFLSLSMDQGPLNITTTSQVLDGCEYLTTTDQEQTFQVPAAIHPDEVTSLPANTEAINDKSKEVAQTNTITVSVVGDVQDQIPDVRYEEPKDIPLQDTSTGKIKCVYCGKSFTKNFDLQQHVRSHTGERPFQCVVCGRAFSQKSNVKKHMVTHKVWPKRIRTLSTDTIVNSKTDGTGNNNENITDQMLEKSYICQYCPAIFKNYFELKTHRKEHTHQKVYQCIQKNCNETFSDLDSFLGHTQTHENEAEYHCHVCNKEFRSLDELGTHQYLHSVPTTKLPTNPRVVTCKKCKSKFVNLEALERHLVSDSHTYPCPRCHKVFLCERSLRRHLKTHSTTYPYSCPHCRKAFKTEHYLNMHLVIHSNERPFACQSCPAAFNRRDKLSRHVLIHESTKRFKCPFSKHLCCTKAFNRKDKLKAHILTHSSKVKHLCIPCGRGFHKQAHLKHHEKLCPERFNVGKISTTKSGKSAKSDEIQSHSSKRNEDVQDDNMSTIEIVVVPITRKEKNKKNTSTFRVTFPATKVKSNPVDLSQTEVQPVQDVPMLISKEDSAETILES